MMGLFNRLASAAMLGAAFLMPVEGQAQSLTKNVVMIYCDDCDDHVSRDYLPKTRALIGAQGVTFRNSHVTTPVCGPSRASFLTGKFAHNHLVWGADIGGGWSAMRSLMTDQLGTWMQAAGYYTGYFGKLMNAFSAEYGYMLPGWERFSIYNGVGYNYFDYQLFEQGRLNSYGSAEEDYLTDVLADKTVRFIRSAVANDRKFIAVFAPIAVHSPMTPAPRHLGYHATTPLPRSVVFNEPNISDKPEPIKSLPQYTLEEIDSIEAQFRRRLEAMMALDEAVEQIINTLTAEGVLQDTDVIFTSDNAMAIGSHRWMHKVIQYDVVTKVPLMWRGPGIQVNGVRDQFVSNLDLTATILGRTGVATSPGYVLDGKPFAAILKAAGVNTPFRNGVFVESFLIDPRLPSQEYIYRALKMPGLMYGEVRAPAYVAREAYDAVLDPYQSVNTINSIPTEQRTIYNALIDRLKNCSGANCNNY